jgi:hypothetical protein
MMGRFSAIEAIDGDSIEWPVPRRLPTLTRFSG